MGKLNIVAGFAGAAEELDSSPTGFTRAAEGSGRAICLTVAGSESSAAAADGEEAVISDGTRPTASIGEVDRPDGGAASRGPAALGLRVMVFNASLTRPTNFLAVETGVDGPFEARLQKCYYLLDKSRACVYLRNTFRKTQQELSDNLFRAEISLDFVGLYRTVNFQRQDMASNGL